MRELRARSKLEGGQLEEVAARGLPGSRLLPEGLVRGGAVVCSGAPARGSLLQEEVEVGVVVGVELRRSWATCAASWPNHAFLTQLCHRAVLKEPVRRKGAEDARPRRVASTQMSSMHAWPFFLTTREEEGSRTGKRAHNLSHEAVDQQSP